MPIREIFVPGALHLELIALRCNGAFPAVISYIEAQYAESPPKFEYDDGVIISHRGSTLKSMKITVLH